MEISTRCTHFFFLIFFSCLGAVLVAAADDHDSSLQFSASFRQWCLEYGKKYSSEHEERDREKTFNQNVRLVESLNIQHKDKEIAFAVNQFADMTADEFKRDVLMNPLSNPLYDPAHSSQGTTWMEDHQYEAPPIPPENIPDTYDWRDKNVVTSVKDQGTVGSCWAFSTIENIEGQWALAGNKLTSLSAEQLVDCDDTHDPNSLHQDCGVFGGWPYLAYQYIMKEGGIESESDYPYCSGKGTCYPCVPKGWNKTRCGPPPTYCNNTFSCSNKLDKTKFVPGLKVKDWIAFKKNETEMISSLIKQGPLSVLINAELLQFYHTGVWDPIVKCDPSSLDHAVLLVGYGTHKGILSEKPYWLIKNSWGEKWGEDGYFMLIRGKGKCGIDQQVTSAILE